MATIRPDAANRFDFESLTLKTQVQKDWPV
jgi:hypothetical protein